MNALSTWRWLLAQPLNRGRPLAATWRWLAWQFGTRLRPGLRRVPFVDRASLTVARGMTGATGNVYAGLHEFEDMAFLLHFLREGECFVDVGANVGSYSVLAAAVCAARVVAFEPGDLARAALARNVADNQVGARVDIDLRAVSAHGGVRRFTRGQDTTNRFADDAAVDVEEVATVSLDEALVGRRPALLKIDVEGAESEVFAGAERLLHEAPPAAIIVELSGPDHVALQARLAAQGYTACRYLPFERRLVPRSGTAQGGNLLLLRNLADAQRRVASAPRRRIHAPGCWL
jgi:FkbM family methyltransferase